MAEAMSEREVEVVAGVGVRDGTRECREGVWKSYADDDSSAALRGVLLTEKRNGRCMRMVEGCKRELSARQSKTPQAGRGAGRSE